MFQPREGVGSPTLLFAKSSSLVELVLLVLAPAAAAVLAALVTSIGDHWIDVAHVEASLYPEDSTMKEGGGQWGARGGTILRRKDK